MVLVQMLFERVLEFFLLFGPVLREASLALGFDQVFRVLK